MPRLPRADAPALPGFAGTADLPRPTMSLSGYSDWVDKFMSTVEIDEPALVIGHSFGGGVAIKLAESHPDRVGYLVLLNSVGGVSDRPIWDWAWRFWRELLPTRQGIEIAWAMRDDLVANLVHNPLGLLRVGELADPLTSGANWRSSANAGSQCSRSTTRNDVVVPQAAFEALCTAVGTEGRVLSGRHSWLLTDPDSFDDVLANVVEVRVDEHQANIATSRANQVSEALRGTKIPTRRAWVLMRSAPPIWLMSAPPSVLAADLALCHPKLERNEVRAVARPIDGSNAIRLTVAAPDRRGLLGDTASVLALHRFRITHASAATWRDQNLALHALTIENASDLDADAWERLGADLRTIGSWGAQVRPDFAPVGRATVSVYGTEPDRTLIRVSAPDQIGLLSRICRWFAEKELNVESLHATTDGNMAHDVFLVAGRCEAHELAGRLSRR